MMEHYRTYHVVGVIPRVVQEYINTGDFIHALATQKTLNDAYIADMLKYAPPQETTKTMAAWASLPAQLAKENQKFQLKISGMRTT